MAIATINERNQRVANSVFTVKLSDIILPKFADFHKAIDDNKYTFYVLKGGRGSSKSTHIADELVFRRMKYKSHALAVIKVGEKLETSVFNQCLKAIHYFKVRHLWDVKKSPLTLTYIPSGTKIYFSGLDDPEKLKSFNTADMPTTDLWLEEATNFKTEAEVTSVTNTIVRGKLEGNLTYKVFISYNPPKRKNHWLNKKYETVLIPKNTYVHHSDYRDNPHLGYQMLEEIEEVRINNENRYKWEYLGQPLGSGLTPFENLTFRTITDDEIKIFDNIKQGIDWGYGVDPVCFGRMHFDKMRRKLYIFDEIYGVKISNRTLAERINNKGYGRDKITADSAEPKSIDDMKEYKINCVGAKKGPGSVEHGEKWLDELAEIVIDPARCPNITREFEAIDYETDRHGNPLPRLQGADNHSIDMVRYALEDEMSKKKFNEDFYK